MDKKHTLITGGALVVLAILVYLQFRHWKAFDWATFWSETNHVNPRHIVHAIALIYVGYLIRAIRWKIFLRPIRPRATVMELMPPTLIGFTGLALLGRPGEFIRPYLIARRQNLPVSSQIAVWAVERMFDIGAFATGMAIVSRKGEALALWFERRFAHWSRNLGHRIAQKIREFGAGLDTIHSPFFLLLLVLLSMAMWYMIAVAYQEVTHSYGAEALEIPRAQILLLMGSSMVGSMVQLPGVGGGSQLATIATLDHVFDVPKELAASCGIMLWLVTFVAVVPLGLLLAHRERLSLRKLSEEAHHAEEAAAVASIPPPAGTI